MIKSTEQPVTPTTATTEDSKILMERCKKGEKQAWEEFYRRYLRLVSAAVSRYSHNDIEDVTQEVFISLFKGLKNYDCDKPIETYVLEIARRVGISRLRSRTAAKRGGPNPGHKYIDAAGSEGEMGFLALADPREDQESILIRSQECSKLRNALRNLSEACRKLLAMRYEEGLSYKEISGLLNTKEGTLRVQAQRCLSNLSSAYFGIACEESGQ